MYSTVVEWKYGKFRGNHGNIHGNLFVIVLYLSLHFASLSVSLSLFSPFLALVLPGKHSAAVAGGKRWETEYDIRNIQSLYIMTIIIFEH